MKQNEQPKQPFFARFLDSQNRQTTNEEGLNSSLITGKFLDTDRTLKYPSDDDDDDTVM